MLGRVRGERYGLWGVGVQLVQKAVAGNDGLQGVLYWLFQSESTGAKSSPGKSIDRVEYGIVPTDSTWALITAAFNRLAAVPTPVVPGCQVIT